MEILSCRSYVIQHETKWKLYDMIKVHGLDRKWVKCIAEKLSIVIAKQFDFW